jgi:hypothetical protein
MTIRAALLDERGVYLRMDEVEELTDRHVPTITACDLPPGRYLWIPDETNTYGGAFWELDWLKRVTETRDKAIALKGSSERNAELGVVIEFLRARGI